MTEAQPFGRGVPQGPSGVDRHRSRLIAITREVSPAITRCELTHLTRAPIDLEQARFQHRAYERALQDAGCTVIPLEVAPDLPDSVFVEDAAVVFDEIAVITRPGAASRRAETHAVAELVARYRPLRHIHPPATIDGGDVLVLGRRVYVGRSARTNQAGVTGLRDLLTPYGYDVIAVSVVRCLHLKSAVTALTDNRLLVSRALIDLEPFADVDFVEVDPLEPAAANALRVEAGLVYPDSFPRTRDRLARLGLPIWTVDIGEIAKAEGAVTCCSLVFKVEVASGTES